MTVDETRALIAEARQEESIQDKLGGGFSEGSDERAFYYEHRDRYKRLADALEARQPSGDDREVVKALNQALTNDGGPATREKALYDAAVLARRALLSRDAAPDAATDARDYLHAKCDCVPDLGPAHCHFCGNVKGSPVPWTECEAVSAPDAATELRLLPENGCDKQAHATMNRNINRVFENNVNLVNELEAVRAERDAALAAIERVRANHRRYTYYELEDSCPDTSDEHREERHRESDEIGEFYCDDMPTGDVVCDLCRDADGERMEWPCDTIAALDGAPDREWEYEVRNEVHVFRSDYTPDLEQARQWAQTDPHDFILRRRKAGPWEVFSE